MACILQAIFMAILIVFLLPLVICLSPYMLDLVRGKSTATRHDLKAILEVIGLLIGIGVFSWLETVSYHLVVTAILLFLNLRTSMEYFSEFSLNRSIRGNSEM